MAIIAATGFDGLPSTAISTYLNAIGFLGSTGGSRITGRNGGFAFGRSAGSIFVFADNLSLSSGCIGCAVQSVGGTSRLQMIDSNGVSLNFNFLATSFVNSIDYNPAGTANDISATYPVPAGTSVFNFFELRWNSSLIEVAVNNEVVYTKVQTGQAPFTSFSFRDNSGGSSCNIDDCYLADDATFRGDSYIRRLALTATASNTGTVTGAADAHTALGSFDGDTSYIAYSADGQKTLLDISDISDNPVTIHAVTVARQGRKSDTGSVTEALLIKTESEQTVGGTFSGLALVYSARRVTLSLDPHDSSAWTKAKVNSMQVGIKRGA